jgi:hypothetical protein
MFVEKHPAIRAAQKSFMTKNIKNARIFLFSKSRLRSYHVSYPAVLGAAERTDNKQVTLSRVTGGRMKKMNIEKAGALLTPDIAGEEKRTLDLIKEIAAETPAVHEAALLIQKAYMLAHSHNAEELRRFANECSHVISDLHYYILSLKDENTRLKEELRALP